MSPLACQRFIRAYDVPAGGANRDIGALEVQPVVVLPAVALA